jgi:hypothetical protein
LFALLIHSNRRARIDRAECEKKYRKSIDDEIQFRLDPIEKFVQTARNDLTGIRVSQLSAQLPKSLLFLKSDKALHPAAKLGHHMLKFFPKRFLRETSLIA